MAYDEIKRAQPRPHAVTLEDRRRLTVTGVEDVDSFDDREIVMQTSQGTLSVKGQELQIDRLSVDTGDVSVTGTVSELIYEETAPSGSLWTKLFH